MTSGARRPIAVVTGGSAGVGRAIVRELAARGYDVGVLARGRAGVDAAVADVERAGGRGLALVADVSDHAAVAAAARQVEDELGPIDVWVNNAMTTVFGAVADVTPEEFERATRVTYLGQVWGTMAALELMRPRDRGTIVSVGSALAFRGIPLQSAYCGAKFATRGFHDSVRTELIEAGSQVRVTEVHLPAVNTPQFGWCRSKLDHHPQPVPPIYQPEVAARTVADAVDRPPRHQLLGTWNWMIVRLSQLMPGVGDHYLARTGVEGQQTDQQIGPDRPDSLFEPVDDDHDVGAHGVFDDRADGVLQLQFLRSVPEQVLDLGRSVVDRVKQVRERRA
jgi:NAD(P)-dependent dehydrogenase (short-subunit alcohol dehydrogenase family)